MKHATILTLAVLTFSFLDTNTQSINTKKKLIERFYIALYNNNDSPDHVVAEYIKYGDTLSRKEAVGTIMYFRNPPGSEKGHFSLLKKDILNQDFSISHYSSFSVGEKAKFSNLSEIDRNKLYKVKPKHTIPQYILAENNRIVSFFGFEKPQAGYTFIVYRQ